MYQRYSDFNGLKFNILSYTDGHLIAKVKGYNVLNLFKEESGKHIVQRVPPTEKRGRKQTSAVFVLVLPVPDCREFVLDEKILTITKEKGTGPGGQKKNKTESACRVVHNPSKISVFIDGRDFQYNKKQALQILTARLSAIDKQKKLEKYSNLRQSQKLDQPKVRTYNFIDSRVTNNKTGKKTHDIISVMKGQLDIIN